MDFSLPADLVSYLARLDAFIAAEIAPLQAEDDNQRFFDHRREWARTDFEGGGLPRREWEDLLREARRRADRAGFYRFSLPREYGGDGGSNLWMAVIREHLASQGPRAAQRPAERAFGGRQFPVHRDDARLRQPPRRNDSSSAAASKAKSSLRSD